jgi:prolyl oligopeptidase
MKTWLVLFPLGALMAATASSAGEKSLTYPSTKRVDHVDEYHGVQVPDPYRWLEKDVRESREVADWVAAENKVTEAYLSAIPERESIKKRLTELWNYEKYSAPFKAGGRYFFTKNDGLQNQSVLYTQDRLDAKPRVLLDPNKWSKDGTISIAGMSVSDDGRYLAYGKSESGSDWVTWYILDVATAKTLPDQLKWTKFTSADWTPDSRGFFYSRYAPPKKGETYQGLVFNPKLSYHRVGTAQADDIIVYRRPDHPDWGFQTDVTEDGRYLIITIWKGTDNRYRVTYRDLGEPLAMPVDLIETFDNNYRFVGNEGPVFFFRTDLEAPRGRVIAIDTRKPARKDWKEIIPQVRENLTSVHIVGNLFVATYLKDAHTQVKMFDLAGTIIREVEFPTLGTASGFGGRRTDTETFYSFSSFATPPSIYRYDLITGKSTLLRQAKVKFNPDDYEVKQVFYPSKDGTRIPMFICHRKGVKVNGKTPTLLYGYGGFNISLTPAFSISRLQWMEMGGIFALANIRGGGEYGKDWHQAAVKLKRPVAYDDFIAAGEWLIANKYTSAKKLAIQGGSNGGLLVGACMTKRPDLYGACLPAVGVMDMLRFHKFSAGRYWVDDYGSSDNPEEFKVLYSYSPYHNLKKGTHYPATLVTTADTDDRVVPSHSFKFIAMLQYCQGGDAPVLARIETRAGHGAGRPTSQIIEEVADQWAFLVKNLGMKIQAR